jgi:glycosyltransferase involved in cell wall biosynthesis
MDFTIVITTFNRLNLLRRAVESALAQTWPCEVIIADDCSTDGTAEYLASLVRDHPVRHLRNPANMGQCATVNAGVGLASGDWVKLLGDDDYLVPTCIAEMAQAIELHPSAVLCSVQATEVDVNGRALRRTPTTGPGRAFYVRQDDIHYAMLLDALPFGTPVQVAFRRDAFMRTGGWDESFNYSADDADSWTRIAQFGDAILINKPLALYTVWSGSYNRELRIEHRFRQNMRVKAKLHGLVSSSHRSRLPTLSQIDRYMRLHWALIALRHHDFRTAGKLGAFSAWSPSAWQLFARTRKVRRGRFETVQINRSVLIA